MPEAVSEPRLAHELSVRGFRCFERFSLQIKPGINLITGGNGSGKTSLVEAMDILSRRRTFRAGYVRPILRHKSREMRVALRFGNGTAIQVEKRQGAPAAAYIGRRKALRKEQARFFPLRVVHAASGEEINGPAKLRRQVLDWGVFHEEQAFGDAWNKYRRALTQRNALLSKRSRAARSRAAVEQWDGALSEFARSLDRMRANYAEALIEAMQGLLRPLWENEPNKPEAAYVRGWPQGEDHAETLRQGYEGDLRRGYTRQGAHRAHLRWFWPEKPDFSPSGGQLKMLAAAQAVGQAMLQQAHKAPCFVAVDDFTSELDERNQKRLLDWLCALSEAKTTVVVTSLQEEPLREACSTHVRLPKP